MKRCRRIFLAAYQRTVSVLWKIWKLGLGTIPVPLFILKEQDLSKIKLNWLAENVLHFTILSQIHFYSTSLARRDARCRKFLHSSTRPWGTTHMWKGAIVYYCVAVAPSIDSRQTRSIALTKDLLMLEWPRGLPCPMWSLNCVRDFPHLNHLPQSFHEVIKIQLQE